ncbi:MAG: nucleotidyl transferase AbiEii/AbiGii toxin family protein [Candidatus Roizmanbacteria bacterium]|nr:nucleotidyl transferase AbiEii/AbiGii toxin family protein [Candidatus Roizmanbacteria bacterium]
MINKEQVKELSQKFKIDGFSVIREYLQVVFLSAVYEQKEGSKIYFKGGTALRLLFNSFRFSEDLDFTCLLSLTETRKLLSKSIKIMNLIVPEVELKQFRTKNQSITGFLNYKTDEIKYPLNIHLEFSLREKPLTGKETVLETPFPVSPYPIVKHLSLEEILAEKIRALMERTKGRDLFDIWFILSKGAEIDWAMTNKKMAFYKKEISREDLTAKIKRFDKRKVKIDLGKFLPLTHRKIAENLQEMVLKKLAA